MNREEKIWLRVSGFESGVETFVTNGANHCSAVVRSRIGSLCSKPRDRNRFDRKVLLSSAATCLIVQWGIFCFKLSYIYQLYSKCPNCQFSYNFYNSKKFKRSGYQWPLWRHRRNRGRSYMTNVAVKVLTVDLHEFKLRYLMKYLCIVQLFSLLRT